MAGRQPKNWDKIVADFEEQEKKEGVQPSEQEFFQSLYQNADDDARRAMMKSLQQSKGTKLIMNWKDVKDGDVKPYEDNESEPYGKSSSDKKPSQGIHLTKDDLQRMRDSDDDDSD